MYLFKRRQTEFSSMKEKYYEVQRKGKHFNKMYKQMAIFWMYLLPLLGCVFKFSDNLFKDHLLMLCLSFKENLRKRINK